MCKASATTCACSLLVAGRCRRRGEGWRRGRRRGGGRGRRTGGGGISLRDGGGQRRAKQEQFLERAKAQTVKAPRMGHCHSLSLLANSLFSSLSLSVSLSRRGSRRTRERTASLASHARPGSNLMMIDLLLFLQKQKLATAIYLFGLGTLLSGPGLKHMRIPSHHDLTGKLVTVLLLGRTWWSTKSPTCLPLSVSICTNDQH